MKRLFGFSPTRANRVIWALRELEMDCEIIDKGTLAHPDLRQFHPLGRIPVLDVDGKGLFESAAITTFLADQKPEKNLIAEPRTWDRALHDQWVSFALTDMEAWAWSTFRSINIVPSDESVPEMYDYNKKAYRASAVALDDKLADCDYLIADRFSVTDIIVGWTCNFGNTVGAGYNEGFTNIARYLERLKARPHCPLS